MTPTLSSAPAARARWRWRSIIATFALVSALVASTSAMSATAEEVGTGPGTISGSIVSTGGEPLGGVWVNVSISSGEGTSFSASTNTDGSGHYEFTGLEADAYLVQAYPDGFQLPASQQATVTVESPVATVDFVVTPFAVGVGSISGRVTGDGVAIPGQSVTAWSSATGQSLYTVSDGNGDYQFTGLSNGEWSILSFGGSQYQYLSTPNVLITDGAPNATLDLPFISWPVGTSSISGVLTDSATGAPIAGVNILASGLDVAHNSSRTTDEAGVFSFDLLPAGSYNLNFWGSGYLHSALDIQVLADESVTADQALIAADATIIGHIKGKNGAPVVGVFVDAHTNDGNFAGAETDENGDYVISGVGAVPYTLHVGGIGTPYKEKERVVTPVANGHVRANFSLKDRKTATLAGTVFGPGGGYYTNLVCATLYSSKNKHPLSEVVLDGDHYGEDAYAFDDLKPGDYTVEFADCDSDPTTNFDNVFLGGAKKYKDATFVTIVAAQDSFQNNITLTFKVANAVISGHVAKPNGTSIVGLPVHVSDGAITVDTTTDAAGNYTVSGLFSGEYAVSVGGAGTLYVHKEKSVTAVEGGSVTADFSLAKK